MTRRESRINIMSLLYEISITGELNLSKINVSNCDKFGLDIFKSFLDNKDVIDEKIETTLDRWTINSISKIDLALLRLATTEKFYTETPIQVIVNEAVEIAKLYGDDNSPSFINSIMRKITN